MSNPIDFSKPNAIALVQLSDDPDEPKYVLPMNLVKVAIQESGYVESTEKPDGSVRDFIDTSAYIVGDSEKFKEMVRLMGMVANHSGEISISDGACDLLVSLHNDPFKARQGFDGHQVHLHYLRDRGVAKFPDEMSVHTRVFVRNTFESFRETADSAPELGRQLDEFNLQWSGGENAMTPEDTLALESLRNEYAEANRSMSATLEELRVKTRKRAFTIREQIDPKGLER